MPEFYIIISRKIFFPNFRGGARTPVSYAYAKFSTLHYAVRTKRGLLYTHPFLGEYDKPQQLVLKSFHGHGEVNDGSLGADLG